MFVAGTGKVFQEAVVEKRKLRLTSDSNVMCFVSSRLTVKKKKLFYFLVLSEMLFVSESPGIICITSLFIVTLKTREIRSVCLTTAVLVLLKMV